MESERPNILLGVICGLCIVGIWSGFVVVARFGVTHTLTIFDVAGLRYGFAGLLMLPFAWNWWPRRIPMWKCLLLAAGPGVPYALLTYAGMIYTPAAHAAAFANGALPVFTVLLGLWWMKDRPGRWRLAAVALVVAGCATMALSGEAVHGENLWQGYALLLAGAVLLAGYMLHTRMWGLRPKELTAVVPVLNGVLFVPVWLTLLPSNLQAAPWSEILLQMLYQGLGPSLIAVALFAIAIKHLGATPTAALVAAVPAGATLIGIPALGEIPNAWEWTGIAVVTAGILLTLKRPAAAARSPVSRR